MYNVQEVRYKIYGYVIEASYYVGGYEARNESAEGGASA